MDELIERLKYFLGVPITATAEEIVGELNKLIGQLKEAMTSSETTVTAKAVLTDLIAAKEAVVTAKTFTTFRNDMISALGLDTNASIEAIKAAVITAKSGAGELPKISARLQQIETEAFDGKFNAIIAKALEQGKILPVTKDDPKWMESQKIFAKANIAEFEIFWTKQPVVAPVNALPPSSSGSKGGDLTPEDLVVAKALGNSAESLKKYNPAAH